MKWKLFVLIVVLLPFLAVIRPYLHQGVPYTHDGENHLARFANYKVAVREGQLPPRFAPNLMNHYGYPVFNYNYPLLNMLSLPMSVIGIHYEVTFKLLMITGLALGAYGVYRWLAACGFSRAARAFSVGAYLLAPFTVNLVYVRGSIGELWALALFPWLLWFTKKLKHEKKISLLVSVPLITAFLLSHNISVLFGGAFWFFYTFRKFVRNKALWKSWLKPVVLSVLLSLWFWLPAIAEKQFVVVDTTDLSGQFRQHFAEPLQLITSPLQFGYSYETAVDTISFSAGLIHAAALILITLWLLKKKPRALAKESRWLWFFALAGWLLLLFQLRFTEKIWSVIPFVQFIQFPWRLTLFFVVLTLPLVSVLFSLGRLVRLFLWLLFAVQLFSICRLQPAGWFHKSSLEYDLFPQSTSTLNENVVRGFTYLDIGDWAPNPSALSGGMTAIVEYWTGSSRRYHVTVAQKALITEPTMYFPGWQTTVNGEVVEYADRAETEGRIGYHLPPGEYQVETRFSQKTWPRVVGNSISALAVLVWGWLLWREKQVFSGK